MLSLTLLTIFAAGCLTADVNVKGDGSGTVSLEYLLPKTTEEHARKLLTAPGVTIKSLEVKTMGEPAKSWQKIVATLEMSDLTKVGTVPLFKLFGTQLTLADAEGGKKRFEALVKHTGNLKKPAQATNNTIRVTFPGPVAESSAQISDSTVTWKFSSAEYLSKPEMKLTALYATAPAEPAEPVGEQKPVETQE